MQEQDDYDQPCYHEECIRTILFEALEEFIQSATRGDFSKLNENTARILSLISTASSMAESEDKTLTYDSLSMAARSNDGRVLCIDAKKPMHLSRRHGLWAFVLLLQDGTDFIPHDWPIEAAGFTPGEVVDQVAAEVAALWSMLNDKDWPQCRLTQDLLATFKFTVTDIPGENK